MKNLTPKQEKFCQEYVLYGNKSQAYRTAYDAENMSNEVIHNKASELSKKGEVGVRIKQLQKELEERNKMTLDRVVQNVSNIALFDIAELYDENNNLKDIHSIPKHIRTSISGIKILEEFEGFGKERESIGFTKDVRVINKLDALEKLMKYFGGYEKDNEQSRPVINVSELSTEALKEISNAASNNS